MHDTDTDRKRHFQPVRHFRFFRHGLKSYGNIHKHCHKSNRQRNCRQNQTLVVDCRRHCINTDIRIRHAKACHPVGHGNDTSEIKAAAEIIFQRRSFVRRNIIAANAKHIHKRVHSGFVRALRIDFRTERHHYSAYVFAVGNFSRTRHLSADRSEIIFQSAFNIAVLLVGHAGTEINGNFRAAREFNAAVESREA